MKKTMSEFLRSRKHIPEDAPLGFLRRRNEEKNRDDKNDHKNI